MIVDEAWPGRAPPLPGAHIAAIRKPMINFLLACFDNHRADSIILTAAPYRHDASRRPATLALSCSHFRPLGGHFRAGTLSAFPVRRCGLRPRRGRPGNADAARLGHAARKWHTLSGKSASSLLGHGCKFFVLRRQRMFGAVG